MSVQFSFQSVSIPGKYNFTNDEYVNDEYANKILEWRIYYLDHYDIIRNSGIHVITFSNSLFLAFVNFKQSLSYTKTQIGIQH